MDALSHVEQVMKPMEPVPAGWTPLVQRLPGVRVAIFDIYGTLLQSAAGDISLVSSEASRDGMVLAWQTLGGEGEVDPEHWIARYREEIETQQRRSREIGVDFPEVEIREVWRNLAKHFLGETPSEAQVERAALCYECAVNPTWEMPGARAMIQELRGRRIPLGLISNAQFYTPVVLRAGLGDIVEEFSAELSLFSYLERRGKPSQVLFERMRAQLAGKGFSPEEVVYFGNDVRKDILPAREAGFRTGLFAGDRRSLRIGDRPESEVREVCGVILTDWSQWKEVL